MDQVHIEILLLRQISLSPGVFVSLLCNYFQANVHAGHYYNFLLEYSKK